MSSRQKFLQSALLTAGHFCNDFYANYLPGLLPAFVSQFVPFDHHERPFSYGSCHDQQRFAAGFWILYGSQQPDLVDFSYLARQRNPDRLRRTHAERRTAVFMRRCRRLDFGGFSPACHGAARPSNSRASQRAGHVSVCRRRQFGFAAAPAVVILMLIHFGMPSLLWLAIPGLLLTFAYYRQGIHHIKLSGQAVTQAAPATSQTPWYRSSAVINLNLVMGLRSWIQLTISTLLPLWLTTRGFSPAVAGTC